RAWPALSIQQSAPPDLDLLDVRHARHRLPFSTLRRCGLSTTTMASSWSGSQEARSAYSAVALRGRSGHKVKRTRGGEAAVQRSRMYAILHHMKRTTIFVPEPLERDLQLYARQANKPMAWVVREAIAEYLVTRRTTSALPSFTGIGDSGRSDIAERHEELLWTDPHERTPVEPTKPPARRSASFKRRR